MVLDEEDFDTDEEGWERAAVAIGQEIRDWSHNVLEVPSQEHGGLPPCPFARRAWLHDNVMVHVTQDLGAVSEIKALYPPTSQTMHIVAWTEYEAMSVKEFDDWIEDQNKNHFGVWIMGFHPDAEEDETISEYEGLGADDYAILLVQSYEHLVTASDRLLRSLYYRRYSLDDMNHIHDRKEKFNAWNEKVNAKAYEQAEEFYTEERLHGKGQDH
jgi:hypothetical protein